LYCTQVQYKTVLKTVLKVKDPNLGLTELMYITELVKPGDVKLNGAVFVQLCQLATHGYELRQIYFVVTCRNINTVHTCNQFR